MLRYTVDGVFLDKYLPMLGWAGFALRGAFGLALRELYCDDLSRSCSNCGRFKTCFYPYFFETTSLVKPDAKVAARSGRSGVSKPFVFEVHRIDLQRLRFSLMVFGWRAACEEPHLSLALVKMGAKGLGLDVSKGVRRLFKVTRILARREPHLNERVLYSEDVGYMYTPIAAERGEVLDLFDERAKRLVGSKPSSITLRFTSPTQIRRSGEVKERVELRDVVANLARRYSLLAEYHEIGSPLSAGQAARLIELADQAPLVRCTYRKARLYKRSLKAKGKRRELGVFVKGLYTYRTPEEFWESPASRLLVKLLLLGEYLHVGSLTTAGCGRYEVFFKP